MLKYAGKHNTKEAYEELVLSSTDGGEILRLKDVAEIDFDSQDYGVLSKENGQASAAILLKQRPGSNAQEVIEKIKAKMEEIKSTSFPPGMEYSLSYDVSKFLDASISQVMTTLLEAFFLVSLVVFIFLQNVRLTIIPILAVPVSLVGTLFFMQMMGFSLNLITLFALVLAIGIVVDNAIVVIEAVHAKMEDSGIGAQQATEQAMHEISGAIIAITLVMSAVFLPVAFMDGPTGIFYKQFSLTMACSIVLSGITALTLTPALCAVFLKNTHAVEHPERSRLQKIFDGFNQWYGNLSDNYKKLISAIANRRIITFGILLVFSVGAGLIGALVPSGFIPNEDQGTIYANVTAQTGATLERTEKVVDEVQRIASGVDDVTSVSSLAGFSILSEGTGAVYGMNLISLKNWNERIASDRDIISVLEEKNQTY